MGLHKLNTQIDYEYKTYFYILDILFGRILWIFESNRDLF